MAIFAELVAVRASRGAAVEVARPHEAVDPVCGMTVDPATARHTVSPRFLLRRPEDLLS